MKDSATARAAFDVFSKRQRKITRQSKKKSVASQEEVASYARRCYFKRRQWIVDYKQGKPCGDCNGIFHHFAMDFDHREGTEKLFAISTSVAIGASKELIEQEIAKCDLICSNCHRVRTWTKIQAKMLPLPPERTAPADRQKCPRGHDYDETNTRKRLNLDGSLRGRSCRACDSQWQKDRQKRRAEAAGRVYKPKIPVLPGEDE